jgi:hypothetical protein
MKLRCLSLFVLSAFLFSCEMGGGTATPPTTPLAPTPLQVGVEIHRSIDPVDGTSEVIWFFKIKHNGAYIAGDAIVSVDGRPVPAKLTFSWGYVLYDYDVPAAYYTPGANYLISVTYLGTTYTETVQLPGAITVSPDHSQVSWLYGGDFSLVGANHYLGADTYQVPGSLGTLTSPHTVPASAYPAPAGQDYILRVNIGTKKEGFGTLHGADSYVWVFDSTRRRFTN